MEKREESYWSLFQMIITAILFAALGGGALAWCVYSQFVRKDELALQHSTWTQVPARVLECQVNKVSARYRNQTSHQWLQVRYAYTVDGIRRESNTVGAMSRDRLPMFKEAAQKAMSMHSEPALYLPDDLCCYVNPENPADVKLFTDAERQPMWWLVVQCCLYSCIGLFGLLGLYNSISDLIAKMRGRSGALA